MYHINVDVLFFIYSILSDLEVLPCATSPLVKFEITKR